jgi:uncharacterized protein YeaO (DUF488 family)
MDSNEYQILKIDYSDEDKENIKKYNDSHISKALELLKFNRDKLLDDKDYEKLELGERIKFIQTHDDFKDFTKQYPIVSKYIIAFGLFSKKSFEKYINWCNTIRPSDSFRAKFAKDKRSQQKFKNKYVYAVYIKYLFQNKNPRASLYDINQAYISTYEDLNKETDNFFDLYEKEVEKQNEKKELNAEEKKEKIINQLKMKLESVNI